MPETSALISNDAVVPGILGLMPGAVFMTSNSEHPAFRRYCSVVPALPAPLPVRPHRIQWGHRVGWV
jgi:hypothetical protein